MPDPNPPDPAPLPLVPPELEPLLESLLRSASSVAQPFAQLPLDDIAVQDFAFHEFLFDFDKGFGGVSSLSSAGEAYLAAAKATGADDLLIAQLRVFLTSVEASAHRRVLVGGPASPTSAAILQMMALLYSESDILMFLFLCSSYARPDDAFTEVLMNSMVAFIGVNAAGAASDTAWPLFMTSVFRWLDMTTFTPASFFQMASDPEAVKRAAGFNSAFDERYLFPWLAARLGEQPQSGGTTSPVVGAYPFVVAPEPSCNVGLRLTYRQQWRPLALQRGDLVRTVPLGPGQKERVSTKVVRRRKQSMSSESRQETESSTDTTNTTKGSSEIISEAANSFKWDVSAHASGTIGFVSAGVDADVGGGNEAKSRNSSSQLSEAVSKTASRMRTESKLIVSTESEVTFERESSSEISNPNNEIAITYEYYKLQQQYDVFTGLHQVEGVIYVAENLPAPSEVDEDWVRAHDWVIARVLLDESFRETLNELLSDVPEEVDPTVTPDPYVAMLNEASSKFAAFSASAGGSPQAGLSIPDIYATPQKMYQARVRDLIERDRANRLRRFRRGRLLQHIRANILHYCRSIWGAEDRDQRWLRYQKEGRQVPDEWKTTHFTPVTYPDGTMGWAAGGPWMPSGASRPLVDVVDPLGPIGYVGNCSVWALRQTGAPPVIRLDGLFPVFTGGGPATLALAVDLNGLMLLSRAHYVDPATGDLLDPALTGFRREAAGRTPAALAGLGDAEVFDLVSYLPALAATLLTADSPPQVLRDGQGRLVNPPTTEQWAQYLYRSNGTRRFLVDSDNVTLALRVGEGAALEPFKRSHRYLDVLGAAATLQAERLKNERRQGLVSNVAAFDPDIEKVVVVGGEDAKTAALVAGVGGTPRGSQAQAPWTGSTSEAPPTVTGA